MTKINEILKETERFAGNPSGARNTSRLGGRSVSKMVEREKRAELKRGMGYIYRKKMNNNRSCNL